MTRRLSLISTTALASLFGAALPAFAQAPAPAPMYAPAPAPMYAQAPAPEPMPVMPAAPVMAPKASDDMTGSVGFGIGVGGTIVPGGATGTATGTSTATSLVTANTTTVAMKYWMSDAMAIMPRLNLQISKTKGADTGWVFAPAVLADFTLLKGAATRLSAGLGLGLTLAKNLVPASTAVTDVYFAINVPVQIGVEHFFTRWFSMGLGTSFNFLNFSKQGDIPWQFDLEVSNIRYMGSLFFYTD